MAFLFNPLHYAIQHNLRWDLASTFPFARNETFVGIARSEVRRLAFSHPVLIVEGLREWLPVVPISVQGLAEHPLDEEARWRKGPPPLSLALHPFQAISDSHTGAPVLAVAHDPDTVSPTGSYAFFDDDAGLTRQIKVVQRRMHQLVVERRQLTLAATTLGRAGLLQPVPQLSDRQGRTPFRTLNGQAFANIPKDRLRDLGENPQHAIMLAASLAFSSKFIATPVPALLPSPVADPAPAEAPIETRTSYGTELELVFNFDN